jgi:hypothetical protein
VNNLKEKTISDIGIVQNILQFVLGVISPTKSCCGLYSMSALILSIVGLQIRIRINIDRFRNTMKVTALVVQPENG